MTMKMEKFYEDPRTIAEINEKYAGKSMMEIMDAENARHAEISAYVDGEHDKFLKDGRSRMLTVQKLIDYLKTQDPNACILAYENNAFAYIEVPGKLPSNSICTVAEDKKAYEDDLRNFYKSTLDADSKIKQEIELTYRYANDNDIIIRF